MMKGKGERIADATIRYLGVAIYTLFSCIALYWLVASAWWCGIEHPTKILWMFFWGLWRSFVAVWYIALPMTAIVILDVQRRLRKHGRGTPNQASHATSEPAPGAASSSREG
jgi:hypothetical protein